MEKPYVKKICDIPPFSVWFVDGKYIRSFIDEEFTNYGQHYRFDFIPKNEFWIDRKAILGEEKYYIDGMLAMNRFLSQGLSHDEAVRRADRIERRERAKGLLLNGGMLKTSREELLKKVKKNIIKKYSAGKLTVWIVKGELVRSLFFLDFTEGGHDKVYPFIPKNEIWLDDDVSPTERKLILLHEVHERNLMMKGMEYDPAHRDSSRIESFCRHHSSELDKNLDIEFKCVNPAT